MTIDKPRKIIVPMAEGLAWRGGGNFRYEEKMDGRFAIREMGGSTIVGEQMADGRFYAFDLIVLEGVNIASAPLRDRLSALDRFSFQRPAIGTGGEFLEAVLARGGEGIVAKDLNAPYGEMFACKRVETFICVVAGFNGGTQSVKIVDNATGEDRGNLPLLGGKCHRVRVGSMVKVEGFGLTAKRLIREPRVCKDSPTSWLVRF